MPADPQLARRGEDAAPARAVAVEAVAPLSPALGRTLVAALREARPHQWVKNVLVFGPLVAAHQAHDAERLLRALEAFVAFSLCASSVYVTNDLLDVESDRRHPVKRLRPFASGELPIALGPWYAAALLVAGAAAARPLGLPFIACLCAYVATTFAYSLWLKREPILDVIVLAALYAARLFSGSTAVGVPVSSWLVTFAIFLFLSLAILKRISELRRHGVQPAAANRRGYVAGDERHLAALGSASGYISVLVLALYVNGDHVRTLYPHPERLWLLCPVALYWIGRIWLLAGRGLVDDDPVVFAVRDRASYGVLAAAAAIVVAAAR